MSQDTCGHSRFCIWRAGRKLGISPWALCIGVDNEGDPCGARAVTTLTVGDRELNPGQPFCKYHLGIIASALIELKEKAPKPKPRKADLRVAEGFVYFVRRGDLVKIGYSSDVRTRVRNLESMGGGGFDEVVVTPGDRAKEAGYHRQFKELRSTGEWFRCEGPIVAEMLRLSA